MGEGRVICMQRYWIILPYALYCCADHCAFLLEQRDPCWSFPTSLWALSTSAVGSLKISSLPCSKVIGLTLGFFLMHCHSKLWSLFQSFQEHDHQFSNDNAVYRCQDKLLGTKCDESATLSKWLHCPMYYSTVCYQSIWKTETHLQSQPRHLHPLADNCLTVSIGSS